MAKKTKGNQRQDPTRRLEAEEPKSNARRIAVIAFVAVVLIGGGLWFLKFRNNGQSSSSSVGSPAGFQQLKGRWQRSDGGYVIDIKSVDESGKMEATYFNPAVIRIYRAEASLHGTSLKVAIELRDGGYAGSTYDLIYDENSGELRGKYFQAVAKQTYDVVFVKAS